MTKGTSNSDDVIDSRDVIARIDHLKAEREVFVDDDEPGREPISWDEGDDGLELTTLQDLAEQCEGYGDWGHGEALIRDSYFKAYAQEMAEDCGLIPEGAAWPVYCIDWERAARELKMDYTCVTFDGVDYWMRS